MLTEEQQGLFDQLLAAIENEGNVAEILREVQKDDFLNILKKKVKDTTLLGTAIILSNWEASKDILNAAKEKGVLKEIVNGEIFSFPEESTNIYYSLIDNIIDPQFKCPLRILIVIEESCGLEAFWKVISENDRANIKSKLKERSGNEDETKVQNVLEEIDQIEKSMDEAVKKNSPTKQATSKAMITGGVCGVIAALAVIGGCFAFGVQLPMLALIGIAVAAALAVGIVAGVITYAISEPSNKLDEPDSNGVASAASQSLPR